jgi:hypothetical protein
MTRYIRLLPPAVFTAVRRPLLFRPPECGFGRSKDFSGFDVVSSE